MKTAFIGTKTQADEEGLPAPHPPLWPSAGGSVRAASLRQITRPARYPKSAMALDIRGLMTGSDERGIRPAPAGLLIQSGARPRSSLPESKGHMYDAHALP